ncbi:MAG: FAD binding domain-containing protein [Anaerolineales bacterium]|nr:FAD binding domain-containing protein [Anaerolineales bacterium]
MTLWDHYHLPTTVDEALLHLAHYAGEARVVAGGTDLLLDLQQGRKPPVAALVDVTRIPEMSRIETAGDDLYVGAAATHTAIVASTLLAERATCLVEACGVIGGPQVRNVATLGGNVAHALPAGDGTLALVALDAEAEVAGPGGCAWKPIRGLFSGPGRSTLDHARDVLVRFRIRGAGLGRGEATAFKRIMRPQGVALPILALAVWVALEGDRVRDARLALGPAGPTPLRPERAEAWLRGQPLEAATAEKLVERVWAEARLRTSAHRATADYRHEMVAVLVRRALGLAVQRARTGEAVPEGLGF